MNFESIVDVVAQFHVKAATITCFQVGPELLQQEIS